MKKAFNLKVGDKVLYQSGYTIAESTIVEQPIDDKERPKFLIGRVDLANGDYITNGTEVYDSMEEANEALLETIDKEIEHQETVKTIASGIISMLKKKRKRLLADVNKN